MKTPIFFSFILLSFSANAQLGSDPILYFYDGKYGGIAKEFTTYFGGKVQRFNDGSWTMRLRSNIYRRNEKTEEIDEQMKTELKKYFRSIKLFKIDSIVTKATDTQVVDLMNHLANSFLGHDTIKPTSKSFIVDDSTYFPLEFRLTDSWDLGEDFTEHFVTYYFEEIENKSDLEEICCRIFEKMKADTLLWNALHEKDLMGFSLRSSEMYINDWYYDENCNYVDLFQNRHEGAVLIGLLLGKSHIRAYTPKRSTVLADHIQNQTFSN